MTAVRMVVALGWSWAMRGAEGPLTWIPEAVEVPGAVPADLKAEAHALLALASGMVDDLPAGRAEVEKALAIAEPVAYEKRRPATVLAEPLFAIFGLDRDAALRGVERLGRHPDRWTRAIAMLLAGYLQLNDGEIARCEERLAAALAEFEAMGERWGMANATSALADLRAARGDSAGAIEAREVALHLATEVGAKDDIVREHVQLAVLRARAGDVDGADAEIAQAFEARAIPSLSTLDRVETGSGPVDMDIFLQTAIGGIAWLRGDLDEARTRLDRALARCVETTALPAQIGAMVQTARAYVDISDGELTEAADRLADAALTGVEFKDMPVLGGALDAGASLALARGDPRTAARLLGMAEAVRGMPDLGNPETVRVAVQARAALGEAEYTRLYTASRDMPRDIVAAEVRTRSLFS
jgi:hypothetical protein